MLQGEEYTESLASSPTPIEPTHNKASSAL